MVKDTDMIRLKKEKENENHDNDLEKFKALIQKACNLDEDLFQYFNVVPKPKPPEEFLSNLNFDFYENSQLSEFNKKYLLIFSQNAKTIPNQQDDLLIKEFNDLCIQINLIINSQKFEIFFSEKMESSLKILINTKSDHLIEQYKEKITSMAQEIVNNDDKNYYLQKGIMQSEFEKLFLTEMKKVVSKQLSDKDLEPYLNDFKTNLSKIKESDLIFLRRFEENKIKSEFSNQINQMNSQFNNERVAMQNSYRKNENRLHVIINQTRKEFQNYKNSC